MLLENIQAVIFAVIYFIGGTYLVLTGILALANKDLKLPGFYQFGIFLSKLLYGKDKTTDFEKEMTDRRKAIRYGILWILIGFILWVVGAFLIFAA